MNDRRTIAAETKRRRKRVARNVNKYSDEEGDDEPEPEFSLPRVWLGVLEDTDEACVEVADDSELDMVGYH